MSLKRITLASAVVVACATPLAANAESSVTTGTGAISASARVNFSITIPRFISLRVGTGAILTNDTTINTIDFQPTVAVIGDSNPVAATAASGDLGNGAVTVRILGNSGNVTLSATGPANLTSGTDTIPWTQISTAVTGGATHPTINGTNATFTATGSVVNVSGTWTYTYLNATTPAGGTYTGQVLYTATSAP